MKKFLLPAAILFTGCVEPVTNPIPTTQIETSKAPDQCFYCDGDVFLPISYGLIGLPGHQHYGLPVRQWLYHCVTCHRPTTGNKSRDSQLRE